MTLLDQKLDGEFFLISDGEQAEVDDNFLKLYHAQYYYNGPYTC